MFFYILQLALTSIPIAFAQCPFAGIDCSSTQFTLGNFVQNGALVLIEIVSGLSVVFVVLGGVYLLMNFGNDTQVEKGKKAIFYALSGFILALFSQAIISFVIARTGTIDSTISSPPLEIMKIVVASVLYVFNGVFALMMLFYGYKLVISRGQQSDLDTVKKGLGWTIAGAVAINLAYALVNAAYTIVFP